MKLSDKIITPRLVFAGVLFLLAFWPAEVAQAHANLVRSDPVAGAVLPTAPPAVVLEFSEELDPSFSNARLLDTNGVVLAAGPGEIDAGTRRILKLALPSLPNGVYNVQWKTRSAVDGHVTVGSVGFSVGVASPRASLLPPVGAPEPADAMPLLADTLLRWIGYLSMALIEGSLAFGMLIWRPVVQVEALEDVRLDANMARMLRRLILAGASGVVAASVGLMLLQAFQVSTGSLLSALTGLAAGRSGLLDGMRLVLLVGVVWAYTRLPGLKNSPAWPGWLGIGLCAGVALTFSLQSHSATLGSALPVTLDWLHLLGMGAWVGGLLPLGWALRRAQVLAGKLVPRFSRLALTCVATIALTGTYNAILQIGSIEALTGTSYGRALILKVALYLLLFGLGAINLLGLSPRLTRPGSSALTWLKRTTLLESLLGLVVLLAAGVLTGVAPGRDALSAERRLGYKGEVQVGEVHLVLRIAPVLAGENEYGVEFSDRRPGADQVPPTVLLRFTMLAHDMGQTQVQTTSADGKRYTARGSYFSMVGPWQVEVILRRVGFNDITHNFILPVSGDSDESVLPNPVPPTSGSIDAGRVLYQANCLPCHGPAGKGDGPVGLTLNPHPADLSVHAVPGVHTDGQLFLWISNGYPGSAMPAFKAALTESDRWNLVNFIRTLAPIEMQP